MRQQFVELLRTGRIGHLELKNRMVMAPMGTYLAGRDGLVTDRLKEYYEERARGGVGLLIVEVAAVDHPRGRGMTRQIGISDDKFIPGLSDLARVVHRQGAKVGIQLHHGGRIAAPFLSGGHEAVSASVVPLVPKELGATRELTLPEIDQLVQCFAGGAERAQKAGLDGVEIHAGHGYLINQFLSRSTNHRHDNYGGDLANRARFFLEIIAAVRKAVGPDYPVWCRIDGQEYAIEDGITRQEALEVARLAEQAGVDAIHVSGYGGSMGVHFTEAPLVNVPGYLLPLAREIKKRVKVPVIAVGRLNPELGEKVLRQGHADFIALGRPLVADPELPHKIAGGKAADIRKCIYCYTCVHQIFVRSNICCAVNPDAGKESEPPPAPPSRIKRVMVVGGGPAGLEVARTAAARGHRVTLYEKGQHLGGSLYFAAIIRRENWDLISYLAGQIEKLNVRVKLGVKATPELVVQLKPDVLVLASGATRRNPDIPGINGRQVINGDEMRQMLEGHLEENIFQKLTWGRRAVLYPGRALLGPLFKPDLIRRLARLWMPLGRKIVILGGGMIGCELAAFLAESGRKVTILEASDQIAPEMALPHKWLILDKLEKHKAEIICEVRCEGITRKNVSFLAKDGTRRAVEADNVIVATGTEPDKEIAAAFQGKAPEVYIAGDCGKLCYIKDSMADGARIGSMI
jgi:2,4-dienoyl-CoA reductase-like NADH-dependent reductase (Old Yellow Enzyme family)/thioredoxin reductase